MNMAINKLEGYLIRCKKDYRNGKLSYSVLTVEGMLRDLLEELTKETK